MLYGYGILKKKVYLMGKFLILIFTLQMQRPYFTPIYGHVSNSRHSSLLPLNINYII